MLSFFTGVVGATAVILAKHSRRTLRRVPALFEEKGFQEARNASILGGVLAGAAAPLTVVAIVMFIAIWS